MDNSSHLVPVDFGMRNVIKIRWSSVDDSVCLDVRIAAAVGRQFFSDSTKLGTDDLCASVQKNPRTDFRNFNFKIFGEFLNFKFGLNLWNSSCRSV